MASLAAGAVLALAALASVAYSGDYASSTREGTVWTPGPRLDLSIRARALGVTSEPWTESSLGLEPQKAPTGAGSTRMPSATAEIGRGIYIGLMPACVPGVDDFRVPAPRPGRPTRR